MEKKCPDISDAEWRVMRAIWRSAQPTASSTIIAGLAQETDWAGGTIKTLLHRLVQKGVLDFQRKGNRYLYRAKFSEAECVDHLNHRMLYSIFDGRPLPMIESLVKSARLSGKELETLQDLLQDLQNQLPPHQPRDQAV